MSETFEMDIEANNNKLSGRSQFHTGNRIRNWLHIPHVRRSTIIMILVVLLIIIVIAVEVPVAVTQKEETDML